MGMARLIAYLRVSTQQQGRSGLGLEAQQAAITGYAKSIGGEVIATYTEVESGKRSDRPELAKALAHAKRGKCRLVIAKLDRLGRNVAFISALMESKCEFVACDSPHANKLTLHILSAIAEHEAEMISARTKAALTAAKARGVKLGSARAGHWRGREAARIGGAHKGGDRTREKFASASKPIYEAVRPTIQAMRNAGNSLQEIADTLNNQGHTTVSGLAWNRVQVRRLLLAA
jgi:DNA invertase Pin-like site-specific DNA recombinase